MKMKPQLIAELLGDEIKSAQDILITGAGSILTAKKNDLTYIDHTDKLNLLPNCKAGCIIVPTQSKNKSFNCEGAIIYSENPKYSFAKFLRILEKEVNPTKEPSIHKTAIIDETATIDENVFIGPYVIIGKNTKIFKGAHINAHCSIGHNVQIGEDSFIHPNVNIGQHCIIEKNVIIHSGVVIGSDGYGYIKVKNNHEKIPQIGKVRIQENVEIGANCTIDRATLGETIIGAGTKLDNLIHIAHNVTMGTNCLVMAQVGIAGSSTIGNNVIIGGQSAISDHITIGDNAIVMGKTGILSNLDEGKIVFGQVGRPHREAMKIEVLLGKLPEIYKTIKKIQKKLDI
jgi:UDP-3-O-[3-hydroxymyristoyl] glucosamine N-acyltransferase